MKSKLRFLCVFAAIIILFAGCGKNKEVLGGNYQNTEIKGSTADLGDDSESFGEDLENSGIYDGYFEEEKSDIEVLCVSGTQDRYTFENNTLTFTEIGEDSVYSISGQLKGNIIIDVGDSYKFELELLGLSLVCNSASPITVISGDKVSLTAKKDHESYIYDTREAVDKNDETVYSGAIHSEVDLKIGGKGTLNVVSENNNGIHSKDDLEVKNLTLTVKCLDNALKGNDSVTLESGTTTLIATVGDGIKTSNSDISEKGNQKGSVAVLGGTHTVYAACDGIDAAYDVTVEGADTVLNIYTDKYSNYSEEVTAVADDVYYIRFTSNAYKYSVKYYNSDSDFVWVNAEYHSSVSGGRSNYYYYSFPKNENYSKMQFFIYSSDMQSGQDSDYLIASELMTPSESYDTFALTNQGNSLYYTWTNYTTQIQEGGGMGRPGGGPGGIGGGPGGMNDGNTDKGDHSTKGIKAANEIKISGGTVSVKSYDDAIHANIDTALENGATPVGGITVSGGNITLYSNDDGLHADGKLLLTGGTVSVINSYEGAEGNTVEISGGYLSIISSDDGINATATSGTAIAIKAGTVYIYCTGDGIDSNSRTSYSGIVFSGGNTVVISNSNGNSAIDTEQGYSYTGGSVIALMPRGGMTSEATHAQNFSNVGTSKSISLTSGNYLVVNIGGATATVKMPCSMSSATVIVLGDPSASVKSETSTSATLDENGVNWN